MSAGSVAARVTSTRWARAEGISRSQERLTASKRRSAGGGANAGAVLGDAMEIDEVVFHEPRQELGHELAEDVTMVAAEVVEAVIGDCDAAAQPAVGGVELDEPRDLATRADAVTGGMDPEPQEDLGVGGGCAGDLAASADVGIEPTQIELVDDGGDRTHFVIGSAPRRRGRLGPR